ncbi:MAG: 4Fe-4S dicluster domain-containing protein [Desulfobacteraceae bacterium]|nr:MAG: 4Fe-4S dicluster domain-containing protein [Desulfobacteraceae bacterium]
MKEISLEDKFRRAAEVVCKQGLVPFPVSDTSIGILKIAVGDVEEELDLIYAFRDKASQTSKELEQASGMNSKDVERIAGSLAGKGFIFNQPSSSGVMVYRLLPLMNVGLMEYKFMGELKGTEEERTLAGLFEDLFNQVKNQIQDNYDNLVPLFSSSPPVDRTVPARTTEEGKPIRVIPVSKDVSVPQEFILPSQSVEDIIEKFDEIAVGHCFCRQRRSTLGEPCKTEAPALNCFTFGKSARHTAAQGFARMVTKQEALKIMKEAEEAGLVHKAFHPMSQENRPETSICNCCKDCCDTLNLWRNGVFPLCNSTYYLSVVDSEACVGCGECVERCPTEAMALNDEGKAEVDEKACFGCGVCARFCPSDAISLKEGLRQVRIMPPRLRAGKG